MDRITFDDETPCICGAFRLSGAYSYIVRELISFVSLGSNGFELLCQMFLEGREIGVSVDCSLDKGQIQLVCPVEQLCIHSGPANDEDSLLILESYQCFCE